MMEQQPQRESTYSGPERRRASRSITPLSVPAITAPPGLEFPLDQRELTQVVRSALDEDNAFNDITTIATVLSTRRARCTLVARGSGVVCGVHLAVEAMRQLDPKVAIRVDADDGTRVEKGQPVMFLTGHARGLLSAERVAVNFMMHLSGIATLTTRYVDIVRGTGAKILDTRKTIPGLRKLAKYAVRCGGGHNHRMDLAAAVLIKDNHLAAVDGDVAVAIKRARDLAAPGTKVEIECDRIEQVQAALEAKADIILLDNMDPRLMKECVELAKGRAITEASGGVSLDTVRRIAETGVDWISIGKLTHSAPSLDMALDFD
jgi:nicotinate-nucleotide pyrophosphorylase (carboxylating)